MVTKKSPRKNSIASRKKKNLASKAIIKTTNPNKSKMTMFNNIEKKFLSMISLIKTLVLYVFSFVIKIIGIPIILLNQLAKMLLKLCVFFKRLFILFFSSFYILLKGTKALLIKVTPSLFFGAISGAVSACIVYLIIDYNKDIKIQKFDSSKIENRIRDIEDNSKSYSQKINEVINLKKQLSAALENMKITSDNVLNLLEKEKTLEKNISILQNKLNSSTDKISEVSKMVARNSRLMTSSSKSELTTRLQLASSLVERLTSGVPYSPTLDALGPDASEPALLRFAKGGAPTFADLSARLSGRAGELRDADKTERDTNWRTNLSAQLSDLIRIRPINIEEISGIEGALLRAESYMSNGELNNAIKEVELIDSEVRGPLSAWLAEAKARQNADIAAKNILAKATAAISISGKN